MATPYPNAYKIEEMFADRDVPNVFNSYLAENIDAIVVGKDFYVGGSYKSSQAFHDAIYGRMTDALKIDTIRIVVQRVIGGGDSPWAAVESLGTAITKYGKRTMTSTQVGFPLYLNSFYVHLVSCWHCQNKWIVLLLIPRGNR